MAWKKSEDPRVHIVTIRYSGKELAQIKMLMKREGISKQEAARRLAFGGEK